RDAVERAIDEVLQPRRVLPGAEIRDEARDEITRELFVVGEAEVAALGWRIGVLRRHCQHQCVAPSEWRKHDAKETRRRDERPVRRFLQRNTGVFARPFDYA